MIHLNVNQTIIVEPNVQSSTVSKIYNLVLNQKKILNYYDDTTKFIGKIKIPYTYEKYIEELNSVFPTLEITYDGLYITFEDPYVERIVIEWFFWDKSDKTGVIDTELLQASNSAIERRYIYNNQSRPFEQVKIVTKFNELSRFTNITALPPNFATLSSFTEIDLSNIQTLGNSAIAGCENLTEVNLSSLTDNGNGGEEFAYCSNLTTVTLNSSLSVISYRMFKECTSLKNINLNNIQSIGFEAFYNCSSLENINTDFSNITYFNYACFQNCTSLGVGQILELNLDNITNFGPNMFRNTGYKEIILHETTYHNIMYFPGSDQCCSFGAFCSNLTKIDLSDTLQTTQASTYSPNVTTIILPETWDGSLRGNDWGSSLLYLIVLRKDPPSHTYSMFDWYGLPANSAMYVPDESYDDYLTTWSDTPTNRIKKHSVLPASVTWYTKEHPTT